MSATKSPLQAVDYLFTSHFNGDGSFEIEHTSSSHIAKDVFSNQIKDLLHTIVPTNINQFLNTEHYTFIPLYINENTGTLIKEAIETDKQSFTSCYLYTISSASYRDGSLMISAISIITSLPILEAFKPMLYYLLHESAENDFAFERLNLIHQNINNSGLVELFHHFDHLNPASRFALTRIQPDISMNEALKLPSSLSSNFTDSGNLFKTSINLGLPNLNFPVQIPKTSIVSSGLAMFGIDLHRSSTIKDLLLFLRSTTIGFDQSIFKETCLTPYSNIQPLHVLLNALILRKKVVLYANKTCYNTLVKFIEILYLLYTSSCCTNSSLDANIPFFPTIDKSTIGLIRLKDSFLIGTANPELINELDWNVFFNLDTQSLHVSIEDNKIEGEFFGTNSSRSSITDELSLDNALKNLEPFIEKSTNPRSSLKSEYTTQSMAISASGCSNISSVGSFHADIRLPLWDPTCFPQILEWNENTDLEPVEVSKYITSFQSAKFPQLMNTSAVPRIDRALDAQLDRLVANHHDDETLFVLITNYLRNLTTRILPAFYHFITFLEIRDFRAHLQIENNSLQSAETIDIEEQIYEFIRTRHIIQPFPLNYPFESHEAFLDDPKIIAHYTKIVLANVPLLKTAIHYNAFAFASGQFNNIPGFLFSWNGRVLNTDSVNKEDIKVRLDTHYLTSILDRMIDGTCNDSWQLNKYLLLQIFKALNSILKSQGAGVNGLTDVLVDLFIERRGDESFANACNLDLDCSINSSPGTQSRNSVYSAQSSTSHNQKGLSDIAFLNKMRRLAVSPANIEFIKEVIIGGNGIDAGMETATNSRRSSKMKDQIYSSPSQVIKESKSKTYLSTNHCEDDEILTHIGSLGTRRFTKLILVAALYLSIRGPEDIVETRKGTRRKDLLMTEFKKFLSGVLNDRFFKNFILVEMDDFVKLTVNDFVDFHM